MTNGVFVYSSTVCMYESAGSTGCYSNQELERWSSPNKQPSTTHSRAANNIAWSLHVTSHAASNNDAPSGWTYWRHRCWQWRRRDTVEALGPDAARRVGELRRDCLRGVVSSARRCWRATACSEALRLDPRVSASPARLTTEAANGVARPRLLAWPHRPVATAPDRSSTTMPSRVQVRQSHGETFRHGRNGGRHGSRRVLRDDALPRARMSAAHAAVLKAEVNCICTHA